MNILLYTLNNVLMNELKDKLKSYDCTPFSLRSSVIKNLELKSYDIVCIDVSLANNDIDEFVKDILAIHPEIKILILSCEPNFTEGSKYLSIGVKGYANAHMLGIHFNDAIDAIKNGNVWLYPEFIQNMITVMTKQNSVSKEIDMLAKLTSKEKDVANLIYKGFTNQEIAGATGTTLRTVKAHISAIFEKTGAKDRINLVLLMRESGKS